MTKSMTAFVKVQEQCDFGQFSWEIRSVNHRYLDINFRTPERFRELETSLRGIAGRHLARGKVDCSLRYQHGATSSEAFTVNDEALKQLKIAHQKVAKAFGETVILNLNDLLRWPGLTQTVEQDQTTSHKFIISLFEKAVNELNVSRNREGEKLSELLGERLAGMEIEIGKVKKAMPEILEAQREKLKKRFDEAKIELDPERLEQEMMFVVQKADVTEEIDRLQVHISEVRRILKDKKPCGRRLDFLMQEFNREANTLGSKSISDITTAVSIELKVLIEQMREQVQNIE